MSKSLIWKCCLTVLGSLLLLLAPPLSAQARPNSVLILSDIHFNPFSACANTSKVCPLAKQLAAAPATQWPAIFKASAPQVSSKYGQETNSTLWNSMLAYINTLPPTYHFVLLTGDFLAHNYSQAYQRYTGDLSAAGYQSFVDKTNQYLLFTLEKVSRGVSIYPAMGNNDSYQGDYYSDPQGEFYADMANIWQQGIIDPANKAAFMNSFPEAGYYAITIPGNPKDKILILNTVLFSSEATGSQVLPAAAKELAWLHEQLATAKAQGEHIWLVYHIPNGVDAYGTVEKANTVMLWQPQDNQAFLSLLNRYSGVVTAIFSAHIHMDGYQLLHLNKGKVILNTFIPAVSPIFDNNPAFKVYDYQPYTFALNNFKAYYWAEGGHSWSKEYAFNQAYQPYCLRCRLITGYQAIQQQGWRAQRYQQYYSVNSNTQPINHGAWIPYYWCGIKHQVLTNYDACIVGFLDSAQPRSSPINLSVQKDDKSFFSSDNNYRKK